MILQDIETEEIYKGVIEKLTSTEIRQLKGHKNFTFDLE